VEIAFGNFSLSLNRKQMFRGAVAGEDKAALLCEQVELVQAPIRARPDLGQLISMEKLETRNDVMQAKDLLHDHGAVSIETYFPETDALTLSKQAFELVDSEKESLKDKRDVERAEYVLLTDSRRGYYDLAGDKKPIVHQRLGADLGMVDIFNFDRLFGSQGHQLKAALAEPIVQQLFSESGMKWRPRNLNVYVNRSVIKTRGFHVDSYGSRQIKAFIYLTNVFELSCGPYTYVLGSHRSDAFQRANIALTSMGPPFGSTDVLFVDANKVMPFLARAGTLIVSDQSGAHRGYPQDAAASRVIAVLNFTTF